MRNQFWNRDSFGKEAPPKPGRPKQHRHRKQIFQVGFLFASLALLLTGFQSRTANGFRKLQGHIPKEASSAPTLGALEDTKKINLALGLSLRNQDELQQFLKEVSDPSSSQYRQYLTPDQFTQKFGPSEKDYRKVIDFAKSNRLEIVQTHPDRIILGVRGTVADIQKAFHVNLNRYQRADKSEFFAPDQEPSVETSLPLQHVTGLNNFNLPKHVLRVIQDPKASRNFRLGSLKLAPKAALRPLPPEIAAQVKNESKTLAVYPPPPSTGSGPSNLFTGNDFRAAYVPGTCSSLTGTNQSAALVEFDGYSQSDVTAYENYPSSVAQTALPNVPVTPVLVDGFNGVPDNNPPTQPGGFVTEVTLDIDMLVSMAPGLSNIYVYEGPNDSLNSSPTNQLSYDQVADDVLAAIAAPPPGTPLSNQISCSWFGFGDSTTNVILMKMAAQGQSFFMAAGDNGAYVTGDNIPSPPMPYNDPNGEINWMTVVGGTELSTTGPEGTWTAETTWDDPFNGGGGGGGVCNNVVIPYYQIPGPNLTWGSNGISATNRNIPDVSMVADSLFIVVNGQGMGIGGTSAAAPLWAGFMALINQNAHQTGLGPLGFVNPALYYWGNQPSYPGLFHDINDQSTNFFWWINGYNPPGTIPPFPPAGLPYTAYNGYDLATGWGSPQCSLTNALLNNAPTNTPTVCAPNTAPDLSWASKHVMPPPARQFFAIAVNSAGTSLYAAGGNWQSNFYNNLQAYSFATNNWQNLQHMSMSRVGPGMGFVNSMLFAVGGFSGSSYTASMECYNPSTNTWSNNNPWTGTALPPMPSGGRGYLTVSVVNGILYVIGGANGSTSHLNTVEAFNPLLNTWAVKSPMPTARNGMASAVANGQIYVMGGSNGSVLGTVESYNPVSDSWTPGLAPMPVPGSGFGLASLNQNLYALVNTSANVYNPLSNTWTHQMAPPVPFSGNYYNTAGVLNGVLYDVGNYIPSFPPAPVNFNYAGTPLCATFTPTPVVATPTTPPGCCSVLAQPAGAAGGFATRSGTVAVDNTRGLYYVADRDNNRIQIFPIGGGPAVGVIGGNSGTPTWGFVGEFNDPYALAVDSKGYLYVGEYGGTDIKKVEPGSGALLATFGSGTVGAVRALTVDTNGDVYAASQGGKVWVYNTSAYTNTYTTLTPSGLSDTHLNATPSGVAKVGNILYVSDGTSDILKYFITPGSTYSWTYSSTPVSSLPGPFQLNTDSMGNVYAAVMNSAQFFVYDHNLNPRYQCQPSPGSYYTGIGADAKGYVYLTGSAGNVTKVFQVSLCSAVILPTPTPSPNCCSVVANPNGANGGFGSSAGQVAVDNARGLYYVADPANNRIQVFQTGGGALGTIGGNSGTPTWGFVGEFNNPTALAVDSKGYLYVGEYGGADVKKVEPTSGTLLATFTGMGNVRALYVDTNGDVYVASQNGNIYVYNTPPYTNNYTQAAFFSDPTNMGVTPSGLMKFTNSAGATYLLVSTGANIKTEIVEYKVGSGYSFTNPTVVTDLPYAYQMARDRVGNIYVSSFNDASFYVLSPNLEILYSCQQSVAVDVGIGVDGQGNVYLSGNGSGQGQVIQEAVCPLASQPTPTPSPNCCTVLATATGGTGGTLSGVGGLAVDNARVVLYVADSANNQIQMFGLLGSLNPLFNFGTAMVGGNLSGPAYLFVGPDENLYVCEGGAGDVKIVQPPCSNVCGGSCGNCTGILLNTIGSGIIGYVRAVFVDSNLDMYMVSQGGNLFIYSQALSSWEGGTQSLGALGITPSGILKIGNNLLVSDGYGKVWEYPLSGYSLGTGKVAISLPLGPYQMTLAPNGSVAAGDIFISSATDGQYYVFNQDLEMIYKCQPTSGGNAMNSQCISADNGGNVYLGGTVNQANPQIWQVQPCELYMPSVMKLGTGSQGLSKAKAFEQGGSPTPTPNLTPSPTPTPRSVPFAEAAPNVSRDGEPIKFQVNLDRAMRIDLALFTLSGEKVYEASLQGNSGWNSLTWNLQNLAGSPVASGLYVYQVQAMDGSAVVSKTGKVAILH